MRMHCHCHLMLLAVKNPVKSVMQRFNQDIDQWQANNNCVACFKFSQPLLKKSLACEDVCKVQNECKMCAKCARFESLNKD